MLKSLNLLVVLATLGFGSNAYSRETAQVPTEGQSTFSLIRNRFRLQSYSEFMSPQLLGNQSSIPDSNGNSLGKMNVDGRFWVDFEFLHNWRILYWQRYVYTPGGSLQFYDPRIGIRRTQVFDLPGLSTAYDLYFIPGIVPSAADDGRNWTIGSRTNSSYDIPQSPWTVGVVTELNFHMYRNGKQGGSDLTGMIAPFGTYKLSSVFSTQHWFIFPFKHTQSDPLSRFNWDSTGMPFVQNGIGITVAKPIWVGVFLNNYLMTLPTLRNTWASLWLNLTFL